MAGTGGREGVLVDVDAGVLRRNKVLAQSAPGVVLFLGLGAEAARLCRFALEDDESDPDPFLARCRRIAKTVESGELAKGERSDVSRALLAIEDRSLRRLAIAELLAKDGFDPNEPRDERGRWADEGGDSAAAANSITTADSMADTAIPRPAGGAPSGIELASYKPIDTLPTDAIVVTPPDGRPIDDPSSPTGKLMAPPTADFRQAYAAGKAIAPLPFVEQIPLIRAALAHEGTYDFQRDKVRQWEYLPYVNASNYAVGVYMAGAKYSLPATLAMAESYAFENSRNYGSRGQILWIVRGWKDAVAERWQ